MRRVSSLKANSRDRGSKQDHTAAAVTQTYYNSQSVATLHISFSSPFFAFLSPSRQPFSATRLCAHWGPYIADMMSNGVLEYVTIVAAGSRMSALNYVRII